MSSYFNTENLVVWLPFDESTTEDKCGNTWTAYGTPTISETDAINGKALQLDGSSYIECADVAPIEFFNSDFTIHFRMTYRDNKTSEGGFFTCENNLAWQCYSSKARFNANCIINGSNKWLEIDSANLSEFKNTNHHFAIVRQDNTVYFFFDGTLKKTYTVGTFTGSGSFLRIGARGTNRTAMTMDEFMIHSEALWTANFTPPTAADYQELEEAMEPPLLKVDVERRISNVVEVIADVERILRTKWRYVNLGDADDLISESTILTNLPETKSKTGTAFCQTTRTKCFDLPATDEIWIKFDVYFDGTNRWRAYNDGANGLTGITAQQSSASNSALSFFSNDTNVQQQTNITRTNQLQTVLLHMISGSSAGVIETWVDGIKIYTYTGDVNHGEDFADIYLQSDGSGTFFSNVIISNTEIGLNDGYHKISFDVERKLSNEIEVTADVERNLIHSIIVPSIGEHFNHYVSSVKIYRDKPQRIILPKKSMVHVRGNSLGTVKIFSDTDNAGKVTGIIYAELNECEVVFLQPTNSPQQVIKAFMHSLDETTLTENAALDEAISYCTGGVIADKNTLVENFMRDLNNSSSYANFLLNYCDINLDNADTGAITGLDASGEYEKTAESIVPEPIPVEDWVVPKPGSSVTIRGLTVQFPNFGSNGYSLNNNEKHILAGLNSVWIEQSLILIKQSYGLDFNEQNATVKTISIKFEDNSDISIAAYVSVTSSYGKAISLTLVINTQNLWNGGVKSPYLDRTIAHELTHAVMAANIDNFSSLPRYIKEGFAELTHGIDDKRYYRIIELVKSRRSDLESVFTNDSDSSDLDVYAAGYMLLRYLAKQGSPYCPIPDSLEVTDLSISYGDTGQEISLDVLRTLIKTAAINFDVEILDTRPTEFIVDVSRAIVAKLKLFPLDNSAFFGGGDE